MGMSAARLHGAVPRGLGRATVATRVQRRPITLDGTRLEIRFVKRPVDDLDADLITTVLGDVLVTSIEQTILERSRPRPMAPPAQPAQPARTEQRPQQPTPAAGDDLCAPETLYPSSSVGQAQRGSEKDPDPAPSFTVGRCERRA